MPRHQPEGAVTGQEAGDQDDRVESLLGGPRRVGDVAPVQPVVGAATDEPRRLADGAALARDRAQAGRAGEPGRAQERPQWRLHGVTVTT